MSAVFTLLKPSQWIAFNKAEFLLKVQLLRHAAILKFLFHTFLNLLDKKFAQMNRHLCLHIDLKLNIRDLLIDRSFYFLSLDILLQNKNSIRYFATFKFIFMLLQVFLINNIFHYFFQFIRKAFCFFPILVLLLF